MVIKIEEELVFDDSNILLQHVGADGLVDFKEECTVSVVLEQVLAEVAVEVL